MTDVKRAFDILVNQCLLVTQHDEVVLVYDETFEPFKSDLYNALRDAGVLPTQLCLGTDEQNELISRLEADIAREAENPHVRIPTGLAMAVNSATVVLNVVSHSPRFLPVRKALLALPRPSDCRFAHIPGIRNEVLQVLLQTPLELVQTNCELLAWALGEARSARLITYDIEEHEYELRIGMDAWENEPMMSPGLIAPGSWGNIPPGETFTCPYAYTMSGHVCLNGSVPGYLLEPNERVVLTVEKGKLVGWVANQPSRGAEFFAQLERDSIEHRDNDWHTVCEIGVGLNPAIDKLIGVPLFDEKASGTVHVAFGDNSGFGRSVVSRRHEDVVVSRPTLWLDDHAVIEKGELRLDEIRKRREEFAMRRTSLRGTVLIKDAALAVRDGILVRRLSSGKRVGFVRMASDVVGHCLASMYDELHAYASRGIPSFDIDRFVAEHATWQGHETATLLGTLQHYGVLVARR